MDMIFRALSYVYKITPILLDEMLLNKKIKIFIFCTD